MTGHDVTPQPQGRPAAQLTPEERFVLDGDRRLLRAANALRALGQLSAPQYRSSERQRRFILREVNKMVRQLRSDLNRVPPGGRSAEVVEGRATGGRAAPSSRSSSAHEGSELRFTCARSGGALFSQAETDSDISSMNDI